MLSGPIRSPVVAGMFYPEEPQKLNSTIELLLSDVSKKNLNGSLVALIAPHAGYQYSGMTAANGYVLLKNRRFDCVVIVSPSHREYFNGISVYQGSAYRTPLGDMPVDDALREQLADGETTIEISERGHHQEHAVEVQLPFIQKVLGETRILPIVMGDQCREYCFHLGTKLSKILKGTNTLLVASTDLSHYHPYAIAKALDKIIISDIERFDFNKVMDDLEAERTEACGGGPTVAVLIAASRLGANRVKILHHCNSGDVTGDHGRVVGYMSAAVLRTN